MNYDIGKVPPASEELEKAVLGAVMIEKEAYNLVESIITADDFYNDKHKHIFKAIENLSRRNNPVDMLTVTDELRSLKKIDECGGEYYIALLTSEVSSAAHLEYHARIIKQKSIARKITTICGKIGAMAFDDSFDVSEVLEELEKSVTEINNNALGSHSEDIYSVLEKTLDYIEQVQVKKQSGENLFITTGIKALDNALNGGWQYPDLIILGGRPSMGKTQFAVHFAKYASMHDKECLFISIEMTAIQLALRMITEDERINFYNIKTGNVTNDEWSAIEEKTSSLLNLNLHIADSYKIRNLSAIKSLARERSRKSNLGLLVIDYLQLIETNSKHQTRDLEVGHITRELKSLAKELNIPIILLAQLNRPQKGVEIKEPKLHDLRESGNIEQDADIVIFPHRPAYYHDSGVEVLDQDGRSLENRGYLIIAKHREGIRNEKVYFRHDASFKKIFDDDFNPYKVF